MSSYLYRLGKLSFRRRKLVLALWLALIAVLGVGAATLSGPTAGSFTIPGTQAQEAQDLLAQRFPQAGAGGAQARVVFAAPAGSGSPTLTTPPRSSGPSRRCAPAGRSRTSPTRCRVPSTRPAPSDTRR
ncbi:hypothetical protein GCM10027610_017410 [Dactylosporangium cerinum]